MIPRLQDVLADDAAWLINELGELVVYKPHNGTPREIYVVIEREPVAPASGGGTGGGAPRSRPSMVLRILNSTPAGIPLATLNFQGDRVAVAYLRGGTADDFGFTNEILDQRPGSYRIRVR